MQIQDLQTDRKALADKVAVLERRAGSAEEENKRLREENERLRDELRFLRSEVRGAPAIASGVGSAEGGWRVFWGLMDEAVQGVVSLRLAVVAQAGGLQRGCAHL